MKKENGEKENLKRETNEEHTDQNSKGSRQTTIKRGKKQEKRGHKVRKQKERKRPRNRQQQKNEKRMREKATQHSQRQIDREKEREFKSKIGVGRKPMNERGKKEKSFDKQQETTGNENTNTKQL